MKNISNSEIDFEQQNFKYNEFNGLIQDRSRL